MFQDPDSIGHSDTSSELSAFTFMQLQGQICARAWCCEVVESCNVRFPTSSQLGPHE